MIIKNIKTYLFLLFITLFIFNCGSTKTVSKDKKEKVSAVCMWRLTPLRESPGSKGVYITSIYYGEVASTFGETATDSSTSKPITYLKIILVDGTEGWTLKSVIAIDATPNVIKSKTKVYKRPDILSEGEKQFDRMQFIVVSEAQDDWVKVKGKRKADGWFTEGWIKSSHITDFKSDVNVAVLAARAFNITEKQKKINALNAIIENSDLSGSQFIPDVKKIVESLTTNDYKQVEDSEEK